MRGSVTEQYHFSGPLYEQVLGLLRSRIESGEWGRGNPLPGEVHLSRDFGVSVGTMRKAMDRLVQERVVIRERGRGTFVKEHSAWRAEQGLRLRDHCGTPLAIEIALVKSNTATATASEIEVLVLRTQLSMAPRVLRLSREWRTGGKLLCLETIIVDETRFPNLLEAVRPAADTLHEVYAEQYRATVERTLWTIQPSAPADPALDTLEAVHGASMLRCRRIAFDSKNSPIELCEQTHFCVGQVFQLSA